MGRDDQPQATKTPAPTRRVRRRAFVALLWENLLRAGLPLYGLAAGFIGLALLELPQELGARTAGWGQLALLAMGLVAGGLAIRHFYRRFSWPSATATGRRVEQASGLPHRPISQMEDRLAAGTSPVAATLWRVHQARLADLAGRLRAGPARPVLAATDRFALTALASLVLAVGVMVGGEDAGARLRAALTPALTATVPTPSPRVDSWIDPPAYTGLRPVVLRRADRPEETVDPAVRVVAAGSSLLIKVTGAADTPTLIPPQGGTTPLEAAGPDSHQLRAPLGDGGRYQLTDGGRLLAEWRFTLRPDAPPTVVATAPPRATSRHDVALAYRASDDYGVTTLGARFYRRDGVADAAPPLEITWPLPGDDNRRLAGRHSADLTAHPWAGLAVDVELWAEDGAGQRGVAPVQRIVLPVRPFRHPVARAIIDLRRRLVTTPKARRSIARALLRLALQPSGYGHDAVVFLALKSASSRVIWTKPAERAAAEEEVVRLLWETALRVENGALAGVESRLEALQRQLQEMLGDDRAQAKEIDRLMDQLRGEMARLLDLLARQAEAAGEIEEFSGSPRELQRMMNQKTLADMVERARDMMRQGDRAGAQQMLSQLRDMMRNLRFGRMAPGDPRQGGLQDMLNRLQELSRRQRQLMDRTHRRAQSPRLGDQGIERRPLNRPPGLAPRGDRANPDAAANEEAGRGAGRDDREGFRGGAIDAEGLARLQEQLRRALGETMRRMNEQTGAIDPHLGTAERAMKGAAEALRGDRPGTAAGRQSDALRDLQEAGRQLLDQIGKGTGQANREGQGRGGENQDENPFGRRAGGQGDNGDTTVPTARDRQKVRDIFEELRRRATESERPTLERDYLDRLMRRF